MPSRNFVLRSMGPALDDLKPHLRWMALAPGRVLLERGEPIDTIYFPARGLIAKTTAFDDGSSMDFVLMGRCGVVGTPAFCGSRAALTRDVCLSPGEALTLRTSVLMTLARNSEPIRRIVGTCIVWELDCAIRNGACNARHSLEQRLARVLLTCSDVLEGEDVHLTQSALGDMLGVHRTSINPALRRFAGRQMVKLKRGCVTLTDRDKLRQAACECYRVNAVRFPFIPSASGSLVA